MDRHTNTNLLLLLMTIFGWTHIIINIKFSLLLPLYPSYGFRRLQSVTLLYVNRKQGKGLLNIRLSVPPHVEECRNSRKGSENEWLRGQFIRTYLYLVKKLYVYVSYYNLRKVAFERNEWPHTGMAYSYYTKVLYKSVFPDYEGGV